MTYEADYQQYTSSKSNNGYADQTFETNSNSKWRVLAIQEDSSVILISNESLLFVQAGEDGYYNNNWEEEIICNTLYSSRLGNGDCIGTELLDVIQLDEFSSIYNSIFLEDKNYWVKDKEPYYHREVAPSGEHDEYYYVYLFSSATKKFTEKYIYYFWDAGENSSGHGYTVEGYLKPIVYLNQNVLQIGGNGTEENPYILKLKE